MHRHVLNSSDDAVLRVELRHASPTQASIASAPSEVVSSPCSFWTTSDWLRFCRDSKFSPPVTVTNLREAILPTLRAAHSRCTATSWNVNPYTALYCLTVWILTLLSPCRQQLKPMEVWTLCPSAPPHFLQKNKSTCSRLLRITFLSCDSRSVEEQGKEHAASQHFAYYSARFFNNGEQR